MPDLERILADPELTVDKLFYQLMLEETHDRWVRGQRRDTAEEDQGA